MVLLRSLRRIILFRCCIRSYSSGLPDKAVTLQKFVFERGSATVKHLKDLNNGDSVVLNGWIDQKPKKLSGKLAFARLRDTNGEIVQLVDRTGSLIRALKPESAVSVKGGLEERELKQGSKEASSVVKDIVVSDVSILNESDVVGAQLTSGDLANVFPAEYRFMQLRQKKFQDNLRQRAAIMRICREALDSQEFCEIETPLLFKSTPEGAREFLVPTRRSKYMYALPQSPQQYKQLLMASGVHKYYQIAKCFRDEDLRADRQPEFTQLDLEMSFANGRDVMRVIEKVVTAVWSRIATTKLYTFGGDSRDLTEVSSGEDSTFSLLTYKDAIAKFGIDKPDLRYDLEIQQLSSKAIENPEFNVLEAIVIKPDRSGPASGSSGSSPNLDRGLDLQDYTFHADQYSTRPALIYQVPVDYSHETLSKWLEGLVDTSPSDSSGYDELSKIYGSLHCEPGDIVAFGTRQELSYENPTPLGKFRQLVIEKNPKAHLRLKNDGTRVSPDDFIATWVVDFPLFNPLEIEASTEAGTNAKAKAKADYPQYDHTKFVSTHHPFTMVKLDDYDLLKTNPALAHGQHYDLVVNGWELGGGSTRIHDVALQKYIFEHILQINNYMSLFGHLLRAFGTGCPPHAGFAIGFDRMVAMISGTNSIRDVIAFPKSISGADAMIGSPSKVTSAQLKPYHIRC